MEWLITAGVPTAITGLLVWWMKKYIDRQQAKREERERNTEKLILMMMKTTHANNILATATARAIQRIPDAHCNGDMTAALDEAAQIQQEEKDFLIDQGIKRIFK